MKMGRIAGVGKNVNSQKERLSPKEELKSLMSKQNSTKKDLPVSGRERIKALASEYENKQKKVNSTDI